jgi:hypothetical protein
MAVAGVARIDMQQDFFCLFVIPVTDIYDGIWKMYLNLGWMRKVEGTK